MEPELAVDDPLAELADGESSQAARSTTSAKTTATLVTMFIF